MSCVAMGACLICKTRTFTFTNISIYVENQYLNIIYSYTITKLGQKFN